MAKNTKAVVKGFSEKRRRADITKWFAELDRLRGDSLFPDGRNQSTSGSAKRKRIKEGLAQVALGKK